MLFDILPCESRNLGIAHYYDIRDTRPVAIYRRSEPDAEVRLV